MIKKSLRALVCAALAGVFLFCAFGCSETEAEGQSGMAFTQSQLGGEDALGRTISANQGMNNKYVGVFFNVNNSETGNMTEIYDIAKLLEEYGEYGDWTGTKQAYIDSNPVLSREESVNDKVSPNGKFHWWAEPLYGYYSNCDSWVLKKQLELLGLMGVDYLLLDLSNYPYMFDDSMNAILTAIKEMREAGNTVPKAAVMFSTGASEASEMLDSGVAKFFKKTAYKDVWFTADKTMNPSGGPLVVGNWNVVDPDDYPDLWLKQLQWPFDPYDDDALSWMDWGEYQHNHNGMMNVSAAQHLNGTWSSAAYMNPDKKDYYQGRGWTYGDTTTGYDEDKVMAGANFQQQWDYAISQGDKVNHVLVTGWNEWAVRKLGKNEQGAQSSAFAPFVDEFSLAYSRECEMMMGGYGDNFAFQTAMNIRRFKSGGDAEEYVVKNPKKSVSLSDLDDWKSVNVFSDAVGEVFERNSITGQGAITYTDTTNRNDIESVQVANDGKYLFAKITCTKDVTPYEAGGNWMNLYLKTGKNAENWEGFDYLVNASPKDGKTSVGRLKTAADGSKILSDAGLCDYLVSGKSIVFRVSLSDLGLNADDIVEVKAADNVGGEGAFRVLGTAEDFYLTGDAAPAGRFTYQYRIA